MKTKTFLLTVALGTILFSCNINSGQRNSGTQAQNKTSDNKSSELEDSIKKVNKIELAEIRQDSLDAIQIKEYSVKILSGKHKYGGVTKIQYQSLTQLIADAIKDSEKEMWSKEKLQSRIDLYKRACIGGIIRLDIERTTIGSANTEYYSIIIKDIAENELYRVDLESDIPETPNSNDYWWNIHREWIAKRIKAPFYVYVVEIGQDAPFKFEVTAIKK